MQEDECACYDIHNYRMFFQFLLTFHALITQVCLVLLTSIANCGLNGKISKSVVTTKCSHN